MHGESFKAYRMKISFLEQEILLCTDMVDFCTRSHFVLACVLQIMCHNKNKEIDLQKISSYNYKLVPGLHVLGHSCRLAVLYSWRLNTI